MRRQQDKHTEPDSKISPKSIQHFGPQSYLTPNTSMEDCELLLCIPPPLPKNDNCEENQFIIDAQEENQMASILIPSIGSKRDNLAISPVSQKQTIFRLTSRKPNMRRESVIKDNPGLCLRHQTKNTARSKLGLQARKLSHTNVLSFGNLQATSIKSKSMERSQSSTTMFCLRRQTKNATKSKLGLNTLQARKLSYKHFPSFGNLQANSIRMTPMGRSQSYTAMSA